jgi:hypothetical protein
MDSERYVFSLFALAGNQRGARIEIRALTGEKCLLEREDHFGVL